MHRVASTVRCRRSGCGLGRRTRAGSRTGSGRLGEGPVRRRCWREGNLVLQTALPSLESRTCAHSPTVLACVPGGVLTGGQCLPSWGLQSEGEITKLHNHRNRGVTTILSTMARRPRSSRAWHFVLSAARRDADARAVALAGTTNWGYDSDGQHSDSDSDPECSSLPLSIPSAVPVTGESFCDCDNQSEASFCGSLHTAHRGKDCRCGEEDDCEPLGWGRPGRAGRACWASRQGPNLSLSSPRF